MWDHRARIESIHDGDTVRIYQDDGREQFVRLNIRLFGTWAPELRDVGGPETKAFVEEWVARHTTSEWPFIVQMIRNKSNTRELVTFDRYVAMVWTADMTECLNVAVSSFVRDSGYGGGSGSATSA